MCSSPRASQRGANSVGCGALRGSQRPRGAWHTPRRAAQRHPPVTPHLLFSISMVPSHKQVWDTIPLLQVAPTPWRSIRTTAGRLERARAQVRCKPEQDALPLQAASLVFHKHQETWKSVSRGICFTLVSQCPKGFLPCLSTTLRI